jgi:hypothetical protein
MPGANKRTDEACSKISAMSTACPLAASDFNSISSCFTSAAGAEAYKRIRRDPEALLAAAVYCRLCALAARYCRQQNGGVPAGQLFYSYSGMKFSMDRLLSAFRRDEDAALLERVPGLLARALLKKWGVADVLISGYGNCGGVPCVSCRAVLEAARLAYCAALRL